MNHNVMLKRSFCQCNIKKEKYTSFSLIGFSIHCKHLRALLVVGDAVLGDYI